MRVKLIFCFLFLFLSVTFVGAQSAKGQQVSFNNKAFFVDGKKFFVKGIGYESGATPGSLPWQRNFNPDLLRFDMRRIKDAGYNTIRTWSALSKEELDVIKPFGLKIIMGIWIDPNGDFSSPSFVEAAKEKVSGILSYSKNYDNIIAYLIMNEPTPEHIASSGYDNALALWIDLRKIIHEQHPNRAVSIANTPNGSYISSAAFDFSAYNVYVYNPVTVNALLKYQNYISYLQRLNHSGGPLIITEFGLSVSPSGPGNWGYGGNSLSEQQAGDLFMYKSLVDGGAQGACIFNYSDGWWKGGNEFVHDDSPEEWFGLVGYSSLSDNRGTERPVWESIKKYQSAIITQPHSGGIYTKKVPVEIFANRSIDHIDIKSDAKLIRQIKLKAPYFTDNLSFNEQGLQNLTLEFICYDTLGKIVKTEEKNILVSSKAITLPSIDITIDTPNYWQNGFIKVEFHIKQSAPFTSDSLLDYAYYPHVGFNYGKSYQTPMRKDSVFNFTFQHIIHSDVQVITLGAAFNIRYKSFTKRITNQLMLSRMNHVQTLVNNRESKGIGFTIFPNPAHNIIALKFQSKTFTNGFTYRIDNNIGQLVLKGFIAQEDGTINIGRLKSGLYVITILSPEQKVPIHGKFLKF